MPGRELDALVAEKVMGFGEKFNLYGENLFKSGLYILQYSTSIEAAWEVVNRLFSLGFDMYLETFLDDCDKPQCRVSFQKIDDQEHTTGPWFADTPPHAICLAALRALGHDELEKG